MFADYDLAHSGNMEEDWKSNCCCHFYHYSSCHLSTILKGWQLVGTGHLLMFNLLFMIGDGLNTDWQIVDYLIIYCSMIIFC